jgi:uncharacterized membrane protein
VLALASITLGFIMRRHVLRIYGLILVMVCVLKLLVFDLGGSDGGAKQRRCIDGVCCIY